MTLPQVPRGTHDLFEDETLGLLRQLQQACMDLFRQHGYFEIQTPMFEAVELFHRAVGAASDIVNKEMYLFPENPAEPDKDTMALRPEGTAPVVRAYLQRHEPQKRPITRWCYAQPMFRRERPQAGRLRQFHQVGIECFGGPGPHYDAEVIELAVAVARLAGVEHPTVLINNLGDPGDDSREHYMAAFTAFMDAAPGWCNDCAHRRVKNPLRVWDCKNPRCQELLARAPRLDEHLAGPAREHHETVLGLLAEAGISVTPAPALVRGLDFYSRTVFEVVAPQATGAQAGTLVGGGRYDMLVKDLGGPPVPALGFAAGVERLALLAQTLPPPKVDVSILPLGEAARGRALALARQWRSAGLSVSVVFEDKSLKALMKWADRDGGRFAALLGDNELATGAVALKNLQTGGQETLVFDAVPGFVTAQQKG